MHALEHTQSLPEGWSTMCYITADDTDHVKKPCRNLLKDLPGFQDGDSLLAKGGDFGCLRVSPEMGGSAKEACRDGYQQDTKLSQCPSCTALVVCIRYPGIQDLPASPSPTVSVSNEPTTLPPASSSIAPPIGENYN